MGNGNLASSVAPNPQRRVGNHVRRAGTIEGTLDLPPCLTLGQLPRLNSAIKIPRGVSQVAATLAHTRRWRTFFDVFAPANTAERIRMLSQYGHGSVAYQTSDSPAAYTAEACDYCAAMRKCSGVATLGAGALGASDPRIHALDATYPWGRLMRPSSATTSDVPAPARGMRPSTLRSLRPSNDCYSNRAPLNTQLHCAPATPKYASRRRTMFSLDAKSTTPAQRRHCFVPCVMEEGRAFG